jgi:hypothetical protein
LVSWLSLLSLFLALFLVILSPWSAGQFICIAIKSILEHKTLLGLFS